MSILPLLAEYRYSQPFLQPLPAWDYWYLLLLPLCLIIAVVYKAIRSETMGRVARDGLVLFVTIVVVMVAAGGALAGLVELLER